MIQLTTVRITTTNLHRYKYTIAQEKEIHYFIKKCMVHLVMDRDMDLMEADSVQILIWGMVLVFMFILNRTIVEVVAGVGADMIADMVVELTSVR